MNFLIPELPPTSQKALLNNEKENGVWAEPSIQALRQKLPAYLFQRVTWLSCYYLAHDLLLVAVIFYLATYIDPFVAYYNLPYLLRLSLWILYWITQGIVCTGLWVIAHECGHQAFSRYRILNHTVGFVLHSLLLVPYHSWRITHGLHHKNTNHLTKDQVFVPSVLPSVAVESPFLDLLNIFGMLLTGWPAYLLYNVSGQSSTAWESHFLPSSSFFTPCQYPLLLLSNAGVVAVLASLAAAGYAFGLAPVFHYYVVPYLHVNLWLVLITYLQHTDPHVPHFDTHSFTFLRGAMATVDRDYGLLNYFFHQIGNTHRVHHLFSTMPHYHAKVASQILQFPLNTTPIPIALWRTFRSCRSVSESKNHLYWYNTVPSE